MNRKDIDLQISENQLLAAKLKAAGNVVNSFSILAADNILISELSEAAKIANNFIAQNLKGSDEPQASQ